jgi:hypothetical protein
MADELTKIALALPKGVGSPANLLFNAKRPGMNTPVKNVVNPPIPPLGGPKLPKLIQTQAPTMRSTGSMPNAPSVPAM